MNEREATEIVEDWNLNSMTHDIEGCVEDIMDGWDPVRSREEIIDRNRYTD